MSENNDRKVFRDGLPSYNPALLVLEANGYELGIYPPSYDEGEEPRDDAIGFWFARRDGKEFVAGDPLSLLGVASICEQRGDAWPSPNDRDLYDELLEKHFPDD